MTFSPSHAHTSAADCNAPRQSRPSLHLMLTVWSERRALARMNQSRLADLGIAPVDASREAARPFWDLPQNRQ